MHFFKTLKFQIGLSLLLIVTLFFSIFYFSLMALEEQRSYNTLLNITARLEHTTQQLISQGMTYAMNAPQDSSAYQRDIKLYYNEIRSQIDLFEEITNSFRYENFSPDLTNRSAPFKPHLDPAIHAAVSNVEQSWAGFRDGLRHALGMDPKGPHLNEAANFITDMKQPLSNAIRVLRAQIQRLVDQRLEQTYNIYWAIFATVIAITLGILAWFALFVLRPLNQAVAGFSRVSRGDFGLQVATGNGTDNEITWLTRSFNLLSSRLHAIFSLIDRLQQGSDMDETLCFVAEQFPTLLPLDWVGALFVAGDNSTITLERSYREGRPEIIHRSRFRLQGTLLQKALESGEPLHVPDMMRTAKNNPRYQFLNHLVEQGLRDAIFLPITGQSPIPGVLAFAIRKPDSYTPEHLELLTNIAQLVTHSFGRTVKLAEHARLAAIGGFASGIAHEIRSPLSTISMALEYLQRAEPTPRAEKRIDLARQEAERMTRLLEEILLYAKPLKLDLQSLELDPFLGQFLTDHKEILAARGQHFELSFDGDPGRITGDRDRLKQILLNLLNNASEAAPAGSCIHCRVGRNQQAGTLELSIQNTGKLIPEEILPHLFEPFFTTKSGGTGLGLGIVKRMIDAHGWEIRIASDADTGTRAIVRIPLA